MHFWAVYFEIIDIFGFRLWDYYILFCFDLKFIFFFKNFKPTFNILFYAKFNKVKINVI